MNIAGRGMHLESKTVHLSSKLFIEIPEDLNWNTLQLKAQNPNENLKKKSLQSQKISWNDSWIPLLIEYPCIHWADYFDWKHKMVPGSWRMAEILRQTEIAVEAADNGDKTPAKLSSSQWNPKTPALGIVFCVVFRKEYTIYRKYLLQQSCWNLFQIICCNLIFWHFPLLLFLRWYWFWCVRNAKRKLLSAVCSL